MKAKERIYYSILLGESGELILKALKHKSLSKKELMTLSSLNRKIIDAKLHILSNIGLIILNEDIAQLSAKGKSILHQIELEMHLKHILNEHKTLYSIIFSDNGLKLIKTFRKESLNISQLSNVSGICEEEINSRLKIFLMLGIAQKNKDTFYLSKLGYEIFNELKSEGTVCE